MAHQLNLPVAIHPQEEPSLDVLLDVDREYRERARHLPRITPRRSHRGTSRSIPILHTERVPWRFTALYSNTERAHRLRRTHDWVVLYFHTPHGAEGRRTVVTETRGPLEGRRVVRGREAEFAAAAEALRATRIAPATSA